MAGTFARELYLYGLLQSELPWLLLAPKVDISENSVSISNSEQSDSSLHHLKDVQTPQKSVCMFTSYITVDSGLHMYIVLLSLTLQSMAPLTGSIQPLSYGLPFQRFQWALGGVYKWVATSSDQCLHVQRTYVDNTRKHQRILENTREYQRIQENTRHYCRLWYWQWTYLLCTSLVPRSSTPPVLIACSMRTWRKKARGISSCDRDMTVTPPFNSQVVYKTDLASCASYEDGTSTSRELHHRAYDTYSG